MSTSFFGSSLFTRRSRSFNGGRELNKRTADEFPTATDGNGGPARGQANGRLRKPSALQVRYAHSHQTQASFLPDLDQPAAKTADTCDRAVESFLPFGEPETLVPRKTSGVISASTNTPRVHAAGFERRDVNMASAAGVRRAAPGGPPRQNTAPSRNSFGVWNIAKHPLASNVISDDGRRPTFANDPGPLRYYVPRDETRPAYWASRSSGDSDTLHPVMTAPSCETVYASGHEWHDPIQEESSDGSESPLAPLDALEGFCDDDATSEDERRLASIALPPPARGARRPSTLSPRTSSQSAPRQSQVMRPLASRIRKLSGTSRSSRSSVGSTQVNRASTQANSQSPHRVPIHLGPLPPLPESSWKVGPTHDASQRGCSTEAVNSTSALGLSLPATGNWAPDHQTAAGVSYIMPPEERSRITTETLDVEAQSQCSSLSPSSTSHSDHSLDTLLIPASTGATTQSLSPMPVSPFLCPTTPVGLCLCPPPRRRSAPSSSHSL